MKRRWAILDNKATEIIPVTNDEMNVTMGIHDHILGVPVYYSPDGRFFPLPLRDVIIAVDHYGI